MAGTLLRMKTKKPVAIAAVVVLLAVGGLGFKVVSVRTEEAAQWEAAGDTVEGAEAYSEWGSWKAEEFFYKTFTPIEERVTTADARVEAARLDEAFRKPDFDQLRLYVKRQPAGPRVEEARVLIAATLDAVSTRYAEGARAKGASAEAIAAFQAAIAALVAKAKADSFSGRLSVCVEPVAGAQGLPEGAGPAFEAAGGSGELAKALEKRLNELSGGILTASSSTNADTETESDFVLLVLTPRVVAGRTISVERNGKPWGDLVLYSLQVEARLKAPGQPTYRFRFDNAPTGEDAWKQTEAESGYAPFYRDLAERCSRFEGPVFAHFGL